MKRQCCLIVMFVLASVPAWGVAQESEDAPKQPAAEAKPADAKKTGAKKTDVKKTDTKKSPDADLGPEATKPATTAPAATTPAATTDPSANKVGPGGRTLRTDYPGKEEAMQGQMATDGLKAQPGVKSKVYNTRIQELERRIDDMKEGVFRSKSRIVLLRETLLGGRNAGSRAVIVHKSKINDNFSLRRALYRLDGNRLFNEIDRKGSLSKKETLQLYSGSIGPGTHKLTVLLQYQGKSAMFKYFEGYDFELKTSCDFSVNQGQTTKVEVEIYEGGNVTTAVENRPRIKCKVSTSDLSPEDVIKAKPTDAKVPEAKK